MPKKFRFTTNKLIANPKRLFLIDSLGALMTAFLLSAVLPMWEEDFGMPHKALKPLSMLAFIYATYSMCCYFFVDTNWQPFLKVIAIANFLYCCITAVCLVLFWKTITILGLTYFVSEMSIIGSLACLEVLAILKSNDLDDTESRQMSERKVSR